MDSTFPSPAPSAAASKHIVDVLIEERAPQLSASPLWPLLRLPLYAVLNYRKARAMADAIAPMGGADALDYIARLLSVKLEITGVERIPASGAFLLLANHPTGITDGIAVYDAIKRARPDAMFYANADAHRACPGFIDNLIPVEWTPEKRTRERTRITLKMTEKAMGENRPIVIFPAGRLARRRGGVVLDPEWMASAASLARKYKAPILPCHVAGPYAFWFHTFDRVSKELRDMTLFHELLNKHGKTYRLTFGPLIAPEQVSGEAAAVIRRIKYYVEQRLPRAPDTPFDPTGPECDRGSDL
ncbi:MAG TPA: 1-acyl-sn-glycerol-3-phosphate acyltransferase [Caulobacterales bacterium]|nr:1-acyl-sn-glycerol-3-phosphate acyltransferase [Caulobacterales bacterium]